jgi:hypothetical protein
MSLKRRVKKAKKNAKGAKPKQAQAPFAEHFEQKELLKTSVDLQGLQVILQRNFPQFKNHQAQLQKMCTELGYGQVKAGSSLIREGKQADCVFIISTFRSFDT